MNNSRNALLPRLGAMAFLAWLGVVLAVDLRFGEGWRIGRVVGPALARLASGRFHGWIFLDHLKAIGFALAFVAASFGLGVPFASAALGPEQTRRERWFAGTLLGTMGLGLLTFLTGVAGAWGKTTAPALLGCLSLQAVINVARERKGLRGDLRRLLAAATAADRAALALAGLVVFLLGLYALSPPVQSDALRYHLAAADEWIRAGRIVYLPGSAFSNFPFLVEMNFALALLLGAPAGAQLAHMAYLALACCALALLAESLCANRQVTGYRLQATGYRAVLPHAGVLAACLLACHPVAGPLAAWPFIDLGSLAYTLGMIWALGRWAERPGPRSLALAAAFGGAAFACKYTNLPVMGFGALVAGAVAWRKARTGRRAEEGILAAVRFALLGALICSPWLLRNTLTTGNPVYPFAYSWFGGRDWSGDNAAFYAAKAGEKGTALALLRARANEAERRGAPPAAEEAWRAAHSETAAQKALRLALLAWNTYRWPAAYEDWPQGPLFLLAAPGALILGLVGLFRRPSPRRWIPGAFAAFLLAVWASTYQSNRFLLPVAALLVAFLAAWAGGVGSHGRLRRAALAATVFALVSQSVWVACYLLGHETEALGCALGRQSAQAYLRGALNYYSAAQWLRKEWPKDESVLLAGEHRTFYFDRVFHRRPIALAADWFDTPAALRLLRETPDPDEALDRLLAAKTTAILFNYAELLAPYAQPCAEILQAAPNEAQRQEVFRRLVDKGSSALLGRGAPPGQGGSNYDYFRRRFSAAEWRAWGGFALSPRLQTVFSPDPLIRVCRILPRGSS